MKTTYYHVKQGSLECKLFWSKIILVANDLFRRYSLEFVLKCVKFKRGTSFLIISQILLALPAANTPNIFYSVPHLTLFPDKTITFRVHLLFPNNDSHKTSFISNIHHLHVSKSMSIFLSLSEIIKYSSSLMKQCLEISQI